MLAFVMDTGIRGAHHEFNRRATLKLSYAHDGAEADDGDGHGTAIAGIIGSRKHGVLKEVTMYSLNVVESGRHYVPREVRNACPPKPYSERMSRG